MKRRIWVTAVLVLATLGAKADKGHIWPHPITLSEASQRAIILHNRSEEVLILGIELKAQQDAEILEFIPFPSEPRVTLAQGNPFELAQGLIKLKRLEFESPNPVKGGASTFAVEVRFSAKVGLHDVTVIRINDAKGLSDWVDQFFKGKGVEERPDLTEVAPIAEDYIRRGFNYFVFDYVPVGKELRFVEPLAYRFQTERIYYPLKTSNIVGGKGVVDLIMIIPGSFTFTSPGQGKPWWQSLRSLSAARDAWLLSSSSKVYRNEAKAIHPDAEEFFKQTQKLYLQALRFVGDYQFNDDLLLDPGDTVPFAYKFPSYESELGLKGYFFDQFSADEMMDYLEANPNSPLRPPGP